MLQVHELAQDARTCGPFAGDPSGDMALTRETRGRSFGYVLSEQAAEVLRAVARFRVLSRNQAAVVTCLSQHVVTRATDRLFRLGFLDRLVTGRTPPLYVLGPEGVALLGSTQSGDWNPLRAFRLAGAAQLYTAMKGWRFSDAQYYPEPHQALTAIISAGLLDYGVLAPRLWPGEVATTKQLADLFPEDGRLIVVAASEEQGRELARVITPHLNVRFTWDPLLVGTPTFFERRGTHLEKISLDPLDGGTPVALE
ncbi:MAG: hypothetical protein ACYC9Q_09260 [Bacillota bacterium]